MIKIPMLLTLFGVAGCITCQAAQPTAHEIVTLCLLGEARCQSNNNYEGMRAISQVILNRSRERSLSVVAIVMQPRQFSCMNDKEGISGRLEALMGESAQATLAASLFAWEILNGTDTYPGFSPNHYFSWKLCNPSWARGVDGVRIQDHKFLSL